MPMSHRPGEPAGVEVDGTHGIAPAYRSEQHRYGDGADQRGWHHVQTIIHTVFIVSAIGIAYVDRLSNDKN